MAKVQIGTLHFVEQTVYKAQKALVTAKFNGIDLKEEKFDVQKDAHKPDFLAKNPSGKVPFLETEAGCIFTSNAIARYVAKCRADTALYGKTFDDEGIIDTWLEFCTHEVEVPLMTWTYPVMGLMEDIPDATREAQKDLKTSLAVIEDRLKVAEYLAGDYLSLADIALVCALREGFTRVFDPAFRKPYPKACAWFERCCGLPQFKAVLGDVKLCEQAEKPKPVMAAFQPKAQKPDAKKDKQETKPKEDAKATGKPQEAAQAKAAAAPVAAAAAPSGDLVEAQIKAVGDEVRTLKEKLKADGLSGKKINDHEGVKKLVDQLQQLKSAAPAAGTAPAPAAAVAAAPVAAAAGGDVEAQIKAVGDEVRTLKEKLKAEGLSGKKINDHEDIKKLVDKLTALKAAAPAAGAPAAVAPAAAPVASAGGDVEAEIKTVGDEIRILKEKLKAEGLSGKKINDHEEIKAKVAKLQELKAKA